MNISEVLDADWDAVGPLRDPVLVVALRGWFDVAGVATGALEWSIQDRDVVVVGSIDPDPFFDFTQERPETYLDEMETATFAGQKMILLLPASPKVRATWC